MVVEVVMIKFEIVEVVVVLVVVVVIVEVVQQQSGKNRGCGSRSSSRSKVNCSNFSRQSVLKTALSYTRCYRAIPKICHPVLIYLLPA